MTGLANRTLFNELLSNAIARDRRYGRRFAVLFIDLDRFKIINDSLGHEGGDQLLKEMASRLRANVRESDVWRGLAVTSSRCWRRNSRSADRGADRAQPAAARAAAGADSRAAVPGHRQHRHCACIRTMRRTVTALLRNADMAMYRAKEEGKNGFQFYFPLIGAILREAAAV
jgi:GGDEF domain-containing protein